MKRDYYATIHWPTTLQISLWANAMELRPEILGVDTKFHALSHQVIQNHDQQSYNGVTVTDLKRDMCVTEELGGCAE